MKYQQIKQKTVSDNSYNSINLYNKMMVARPKKLKNPTTSVIVVRITVLPIAGSISIFLAKVE